MLLNRVKTPCIGVCSTGIGDSVCRGCKRFAHEVIDWNRYSEEQKRIIDRRLAGFLSQCVRNRLLVVDERRLRSQLLAQQIRFNETHDAYCWAYSLLKAGASQIGDPADFGLFLHREWQEGPRARLREEIDQEFYTLSVAHYERYVQLPMMREGASR
jgi:predicted Fe-S protein YdhL (DUF1289 family)